MSTDALPLADAVPDLPGPGDPQPAPDPAPKRGRGRPKGSGKRDTAPKATPQGSGSSGAQRGPGRPSTIERLERSLTDQFGALAMMVTMVNPAVGVVLMEDAPAHGAALAKLAEQNARVRKMLEGGLTGSAWLGVLVAFGGTAYKVNVALKAPAPTAAQQPANDPLATILANLGGTADGGA